MSYWFASLSFTALQTLSFAYVDNKALKDVKAEREAKAQESLRGKLREKATIDAAVASRDNKKPPAFKNLLKSSRK